MCGVRGHNFNPRDSSTRFCVLLQPPLLMCVERGRKREVVPAECISLCLGAPVKVMFFKRCPGPTQRGDEASMQRSAFSTPFPGVDGQRRESAGSSRGLWADLPGQGSSGLYIPLSAHSLRWRSSPGWAGV